jgi:hypothetical protein
MGRRVPVDEVEAERRVLLMAWFVVATVSVQRASIPILANLVKIQ